MDDELKELQETEEFLHQKRKLTLNLSSFLFSEHASLGVVMSTLVAFATGLAVAQKLDSGRPKKDAFLKYISDLWDELEKKAFEFKNKKETPWKSYYLFYRY